MHYQQVIDKLLKGEAIPESVLRGVCEKLIELLAEESNLLVLDSPINIIGDVHGQFYDLLQMLAIGGLPPAQKYLFLGDYVDRGYNSLETFLLLATYKIMHPDCIFLLRGNHQSRQISREYGFYEESHRKYGSPSIWNLFNEVFDYLPLGAVVNREIFCVHGGLSPAIRTLDQINQIERVSQIPNSGGFGDLVWSDPQEVETWLSSSRGVGWLFGRRVAKEFNHHNWLKLIVRSHQLVEKGYQWWFRERSLVSIWSAPNYCYRCGNKACLMRVNGEGQFSFEFFTQDPRSIQSVHYSKLMPYFL